MNLPKVLILNQPFNNDTGGGITLSNLFSGWDRNNLGVASSPHLLADNIDTHVCNNYYQLGNKEKKWVFPFRYFRRKYYSGPITFDSDRIQSLKIARSSLRAKIILNYLFPFLEYLGLYYWISKTSLSSEFCKWLDAYDPDVIYAQAASREDIRFCLEVHSYLKKPLIFHVMDDWPSMVGNKGLLKSFWRKRVNKDIQKIINQAHVVMSISDYMAEEYKRRYKKRFLTFHNTINIDFWKKDQRSSYELSLNPTILYAGRIGLGIDKSLKFIAEAIDKVNEELNINISFNLQTPEKPLWINNYNSAVHKELVSYEDLPRKFSKADFLILPYDFSKKSLDFIRYSMPTKAPEYMMSGTPIILFAPLDTAITKYCQQYNCAKMVTNYDVLQLTSAIKELISSEGERREIAQNAIRVAENKHNSLMVSKEFQKVILSV